MGGKSGDWSTANVLAENVREREGRDLWRNLVFPRDLMATRICRSRIREVGGRTGLGVEVVGGGVAVERLEV